MLIINRQAIEKLIKNLETSGELEQCQDEIRRMLEIESELLWWAESGKCCKWQAKPNFDGKIGLLKDALNSLAESNTAQASSFLREYADQREDYERGIILS